MRKSGPVPELRSRRVFRGPTASRGPGSERGSPPRFRLVTRQPAELVTAFVTAPSGSVFGAKSAQNGQLRKVRFSCQTASGMPEPQVSLVFGRKQAPDARSFRRPAPCPCGSLPTGRPLAPRCSRPAAQPRGPRPPLRWSSSRP